MAKWIAADSSGVRVEIEAATAEAAAQEYVDGGDWGDQDETAWINVRVWPADDPDESERFKVEVEPKEPKCTADEHDWQAPHAIVGGIKENPGVYGHGGGVTIQEVCMNCGCGRLKDTWAQDPEDGSQGHESIRYEPGKYAAQVDRREGEEADEED